MTFIKPQPGEHFSPSSPSPGSQEAAALRRRRFMLLLTIAEASDMIRRIDDRLSYLKVNK